MVTDSKDLQSLDEQNKWWFKGDFKQSALSHVPAWRAARDIMVWISLVSFHHIWKKRRREEEAQKRLRGLVLIALNPPWWVTPGPGQSLTDIHSFSKQRNNMGGASTCGGRCMATRLMSFFFLG